uniref:MA3 DOMAIN-CONTAINING TRANSLATION REGULATORY FACTOR 2 n=1 Tax=Erigeron canadensis TaxID=72917 RepID=UPI001CB963A3|nr:MA3 DOMAIN-CONTAINING TRANSLATION REGULATORY FACTOR 2 [Erigeron canadensis]XP_043636219.1 MA3 DOMAIN-CONTAINING TRANSLATION REGULATORY FACTOR 2 [Erigeron canadensis]
MDLSEGYKTNDHTEEVYTDSESVDPSSVSSLRILTSPRSPKVRQSKDSPIRGSPTNGVSPRKNDRRAHTGIDAHPKKGGCGGKGTWVGLLDVDGNCFVDINDPNYSSTEENDATVKKVCSRFEMYKKKVIVIVEEYFATDDVISAANELKDLQMPSYSYYFVKKLISMAMDRHDKEKEMAAVLLSSLYADVIDPRQVYKGFRKLVESADDLIVDIPDTVDILALFLARAVVDDILPPAFLKKEMDALPGGAKGIDVIKRADKGYLSAPLHAEVIERRWGGSQNKTVENVKAKIDNLLVEYVVSGDKKEAIRCINDLKVPFFHHEIVKQAIIMAMERNKVEGKLLDLLKTASEECLINSSQISKGFTRIIDSIDDLSLDIPNAKELLQSLISKAASEGWLCASSLKQVSSSEKNLVEDSIMKVFKAKAQSIIQEYFLTGDVLEVNSCLESENLSSIPELKAVFVKRLIMLAMERKKREKEMASVLLSSLYFPADDVVNGFTMLIQCADDIALDIPVVVEDLAMFLARAVVDDVLAPLHLEEIGGPSVKLDSIGNQVLKMARSLLNARLSGERILRCWGGGGSYTNGWAIEDVKDQIGKLLEEFESGGGTREACRCITELGMPFFHHEVVKKSLVTIIEKKNDRVWRLLKECFNTGIITQIQMTKGFGRVAESLDDLSLDVPDANKQFGLLVERANAEGWLDTSFSFNKAAHPMENGYHTRNV